MSDFEKELIDKIDRCEKLTEREIRSFVWEVGEVVSQEEGENRRWSRRVTVVKQVDDRFFEVSYEEGLTECQENGYYEQPYEVTKHEYEKTIKVVEWNKVSKEEV